MTHGVLAPQRSMFTSRRTVNGSRLSPSPSPWVRPADWLPITPPVPSDNRIVGLHAVQNGGSNFVRVTCRGAYRVDWGDGAGWVNYADNTPAEKNLSWGDYSSGTLTAAGYRQAIIMVEAQAGQNLTQVYLNERHSASSQTYGTGWLDVAIASSSTVDLRITGFSGVAHPMLERFTCDASLTSVGPSFSQSYALRSVSLDTSSVTNFSNMFYNCSSLQQSDITGTTYAISYASANLSAAALNNIYTKLGTAAGAQTITVTSNWGTAGDDPTIATAKGWTVAGS